jgi:restriction system protein
MSGTEFEYYMASVFEALGYNATILAGAGDQGVDLLLRRDHELVAVQCKNYGQVAAVGTSNR